MGLGDRFDMGIKDDSWISRLHCLTKEETLKEEQIWSVGFGDHECFVELVEFEIT